MKKLLTILCVTCALALVANAEETKEKEGKKKAAPTAEQKALRKEITEKYDTNKNKRLDKEERSKMSAEDKARWEKAFPDQKKGEGKGEGKKKKEKN